MKYHFEKVVSPDGCSFRTEDVRGPVVDCVFHVHPELEITYVESSFGVRFIGDNISQFSEDDLVMTGEMLPHHYYNSPEDSLGPAWSCLKVIKFRRDFAGDRLFNIPEFATIGRMLNDSIRGLAFGREVARHVKPLIDKIFVNRDSSRVILFLELLSTLAQSSYATLSATSPKPTDTTTEHRIAKVLDFIHSRIEKNLDISLGEAAKVACMTPQAFSSYFRHTTRKRFIEYVVELKIGRACGMLSSTSLTILDISARAGFKNLSNFNRHFLKTMHSTPSEFRKKNTCLVKAVLPYRCATVY
ncbi:MAG: helix-turn-helix domain-containing protein [Victivallales bacterium]|nr:helix-turn-helix domain-containing protein [Victivallales bacterium]